MATTYAVGSGDHIKPWRNVRVRHLGVDSGQTMRVGDPVIFSTDAGDEHLIKVAGDNPTAGIIGFCAEAPASGYTKGDKVAVWIATPDAEFVGRLNTVGAVAADLAVIGTARALEIDSTNSIWSVEDDDAGNDAVRVLELLNPITRQPLTADGDVNALCVFKVVPGASVYNSTSAT